MFDPTKINLDLDNLDKDLSETKKQNSNKDLQNSENKVVEDNKKQDILSSDLEVKETKEEENKLIKENKQENNENNKSNELIQKVENNKKENSENKEEKKEKIIFDININSLKDILKYLLIKKFDFLTIEPSEDKVKINFKTKTNTETKYIKYHTYLNILLEAKKLWKLKVEETKKTQENKTQIVLEQKKYDFIIKTVPSNVWEKVFIKLKELLNAEKQAKKKQKMSLGKLLSILAWMLLVAIVLGWIFMTIVIFNSNSVADLQFFNNIWVNTDAIKDFAAKLVNAFFGITILIEIIFLFFFAYKAFLTKKEFKQKRIRRIIISTFLLVLTTITFITWIFLYKKIMQLKWINYWKIEFYDNTKFISKLFSEKNSKIDITENIIWPAVIRFDDKEFIKKLLDDWFHPKTVIWKIWKEEFEKPVNDNYFIYTFDKKWLYKVKLIVKWTNIKWDIDEKVKEVWNININNIVKIKEIKLDNSWKKYNFDASDLAYLWKVYWYYIPSLEGKSDDEINKIVAKALAKEKRIWYNFNSKNIFDWEEYYAIKIISWDKTEKEIQNTPLAKVFIVWAWNEDKISWEIKATRDIEDYRKYNFSLVNPKEKFWWAYIKEVLWKIEDVNSTWEKVLIPIKKEINLTNIEESSTITYSFKKPWEHKVYLQIKDSENNTYDLKPIIVNVAKKIKLRTKLIFKSDTQDLQYKKDIFYEENNDIYFLENILAPSKIEIDASKIKSLNPKYWLNKVSWDLENNWNFSVIENKIKYYVYKAWIQNIRVKYEFVNKLNPKEKIEKIQTISISSLDKEALLDLKMDLKNTYVPVVVKFDASKSKVTWKNIDKFIFDYWDGTKPEARDAINPWHKYIKAWNYRVKLTVVTDDWLKYSITKKLVLKDREQKAVIRTSLKKAPVLQAIDFSAEDSVWEVAKYFWDFWDWEISTQANPTHFYKKPWKYKVKLNLEFTDRNVSEAEKEIEIYEE